MTEEESIRHKLDMINRNSYYGLPVDQSEIAKIINDCMKKDIGRELDSINCPKPPIYIGPVKVKTLKERLEEMQNGSHQHTEH